MKLIKKIFEKQDDITIEKFREKVQGLINKLIDYNYSVSEESKLKINLVVEYYIMKYYKNCKIKDITYEEFLNNIDMNLIIIMDTLIYDNLIKKEYNDVLWWIIYQLFMNEDIIISENTSEFITRIDEAINCIENDEYPDSYINTFGTYELEECINQLYLILMSEFIYSTNIIF